MHQLHETIAEREPSCVAPVGLAWELSLSERPDLRLHDADGNHANKNGSLLTAFVLYEVITEKQAVELPPNESIKVNASTQVFLRGMASTTVNRKPPCKE